LRTVLPDTVEAAVAAVRSQQDWGPSGRRDGQYAADLSADAAALKVLHGAGLRVLSEESGLDAGEGPVAVLDPLDGSTNAARGLPWCAVSVCVVDDDGPLLSVVHDVASGDRFEAHRGRGAWCNGAPLPRRIPVALTDSIVVVNAVPPTDPGWAQYRCMGATALDLCAVADGRFDASVDYDGDALGPWDYLGGMLVCAEVGIEVVDAFGRDLVVLDHDARRVPVAASSMTLDALVAARRAA